MKFSGVYDSLQLVYLYKRMARQAGNHVGEFLKFNYHVLSKQIRAQIDDAVAGECPFCGELMIKEIAEAFISSEETDEVASWSLASVV